jgi:hypothetical protein
MKYLEKVREMERHFKGYSVQLIPRDNNNEADKLAKAAARNQEMPSDLFFEIIKEPSIKETRPKIMNVVETPNWRAEIMEYLRGHYEPQDELVEKRLEQRVRNYTVVNGELVVWTSLGPLPRWVPGPTTRWAPGTTRLALHGT